MEHRNIGKDEEAIPQCFALILTTPSEVAICRQLKATTKGLQNQKTVSQKRSNMDRVTFEQKPLLFLQLIPVKVKHIM